MTLRPLPTVATLLLLLPPLAVAQEPTAGTAAATPAATGEERDRGDRDGYFSVSAGWDADTLDTSYAFVSPQYSHPIGEKTSLHFKLGFNYLAYDIERSGGRRTEVRSPGISPGLGIRWDLGDTTVGLSAAIGFKDRKKTEVDAAGREIGTPVEENDADLGVGANLYSKLSRRQVLQGLVNYNTADEYLWSRLTYKYQLSNADWRDPLTWFVGVEGTGQGNDEIKTWAAGGLLELSFARHDFSLQGRGGWKKATYEDADDRTGTYYGIGLYKRF